jgi:hypothetical protein
MCEHCTGKPGSPNKTGMVVARQMTPYTTKFENSTAAPKANDGTELYGIRRSDKDDSVPKRHICVSVGLPFGDSMYTKQNENDNTILISANMIIPSLSLN